MIFFFFLEFLFLLGMGREEKEINNLFLSNPFLFLHLKEKKKERGKTLETETSLLHTLQGTVSGNKRLVLKPRLCLSLPFSPDKTDLGIAPEGRKLPYLPCPTQHATSCIGSYPKCPSNNFPSRTIIFHREHLLLLLVLSFLSPKLTSFLLITSSPYQFQ